MEELETARTLVREGKLAKSLRVRLIVFALLSILFGAAVLFDVFSYDFNISLALGFSSVSFLIGLFLLSRLNPVSWDKEREVMILGRMDVFGFILIALFFLLRISMNQMLEDRYHSVIVVSGVTYSIVFGLMFGRLIGILATIHRVHTDKDNDFGN